MRVRALFVIVTVAGLLAVLPGSARAGGNWLDIRRDDGVPGGPWDSFAGPFVVGTALELRGTMYARGAEEMNALHNDGPFYAWIVPARVRVDGTRVPEGAIRLSAFTLRWESRHGLVATTSLTLPALASGRYSILVCNDPCTLFGFGEYMQGWVGVTQSVEEARLQRSNERQRGEIQRLRQQLRRSSSDVEEVRAALDLALANRETLMTELGELRERAAVAQQQSVAAAARPPARALVGPWAGVAIGAGLLAIAAALVVRGRRRLRVRVPDSPEELFEEVRR